MKHKTKCYAFAALWFALGLSLLVLVELKLINMPLAALGAFGDFFCAAVMFEAARVRK